MGHTEARIFTPPLRELTEETSYGFAVIRFAKYVLKTPLDPWQEWLVIRAGELLPDGRPRFRQVLVLVARQNGKTFLMEVLAMYWLLVEMQKLILGMSSNLQLAKDTMLSSVERVDEVPQLSRNLCDPKVGNNDVSVSTRGLVTPAGRKKVCSYKTAAATRKAARGKRVDRLMVDELREQLDMEAYAAGMFTMQARPYGQAWFFSNQGDDRSVVLDMLHTMAMAYIKNPEAEDVDERLGLFEWSAPLDFDVMNKLGWQMANPNLGRHNDESSIASEAKKAKRLGGEAKAKFQTEVLCQRVKSMNAAIDPEKWAECESIEAMPNKNVALCLDISLDSQHATLTAAEVLEDGRVRAEIVKAWEGKATTLQVQRDLPGIVARVKPRKVGWMPIGPAAVLAAQMKPRPGVRPWLGGTPVEAISEEVASVCMSLATLVDSNQFLHNGDPLLTLHALGVAKKESGDRWKFSRAEGPCDAIYSAAGAVQLARTLPRNSGVQLMSVKPSER